MPVHDPSTEGSHCGKFLEKFGQDDHLEKTQEREKKTKRGGSCQGQKINLVHHSKLDLSLASRTTYQEGVSLVGLN